MPVPGEIYRDDAFYLNSETRQPMPKYLVVLGSNRAGDIVFRLLTSRQGGRPENPPCYHGDPYPGYFLGVLGQPLAQKSWVDLHGQDDYDAQTFAQYLAGGRVTLILVMSRLQICAVLDCSSRAMDTTTQQASTMLDSKASLRC
jgi:hypothetical protein